MQVDIKLNIGTFILLGVITGLSYALYTQTNKVKELTAKKGVQNLNA